MLTSSFKDAPGNLLLVKLRNKIFNFVFFRSESSTSAHPTLLQPFIKLKLALADKSEIRSVKSEVSCFRRIKKVLKFVLFPRKQIFVVSQCLTSSRKKISCLLVAWYPPHPHPHPHTRSNPGHATEIN